MVSGESLRRRRSWTKCSMCGTRAGGCQPGSPVDALRAASGWVGSAMSAPPWVSASPGGVTSVARGTLSVVRPTPATPSASGVDGWSVALPRVSGLAGASGAGQADTRRFGPSPAHRGNDFGPGAKAPGCSAPLVGPPRQPRGRHADGVPSALGRRGGSRSVALTPETRSRRRGNVATPPPVTDGSHPTELETRPRGRRCNRTPGAPQGRSASSTRAGTLAALANAPVAPHTQVVEGDPPTLDKHGDRASDTATVARTGEDTQPRSRQLRVGVSPPRGRLTWQR